VKETIEDVDRIIESLVAPVGWAMGLLGVEYGSAKDNLRVHKRKPATDSQARRVKALILERFEIFLYDRGESSDSRLD
jgi:hypothetical protein